MRTKKSNGTLRLLVVAGTNVAVLGWDLPEAEIKADKVLGFAIQRTREKDAETIWSRSLKTFETVVPDPAPGVPVSSHDHPIQGFQWSDYTVEPSQTYTYKLVAMTGEPGALTEGRSVSAKVTTESVEQAEHSVFFNRGAVASQEYARRFQNRAPDEIGQAAFDWLSRGLIEGILNFINSTKSGDALYGAYYEFKNELVYAALKAANQRGVTVSILYDGKDQKDANETAMTGKGVAGITSPRTNAGSFAHNKFLILVHGGQRVAVLTGSTNLSKNGIYGHSNNVHIIRNAKIAEDYFEYWQILQTDESRAKTATAVESINGDPSSTNTAPISAVFSPRKSLSASNWYAEQATQAQRGLFATFAFGMNTGLVDAYDQEDQCLRYALMEKKGNGKTLAAQSAEIDRIRKLKNVTIAVGNSIQKVTELDRWLSEINKIDPKAHVLYIHTKYMLIDPLGDNPILIVGSANFSKASTDTNDENMLVIRGNKAVADIYLGEYMRLFSHYAFREMLRLNKKTDLVEAMKRNHLIGSTKWAEGSISNRYFAKGHDRELRRLYFSGQ